MMGHRERKKREKRKNTKNTRNLTKKERKSGKKEEPEKEEKRECGKKEAGEEKRQGRKLGDILGSFGGEARILGFWG